MNALGSSAGTGPGPYAGRRVALLTKHGKERVIAPVLDAALGCRVERVTGFDTDRLGTFTRERPRAGTQLDAARRKARIGMAISGLPIGLGSEGSFGADPVSGVLPWNAEILVWIDDERALEVIGRAHGSGAFAHLLAREWNEVEAFARTTRFPAHRLVVRADGDSGAVLRKGVRSWSVLADAFRRAKAESSAGSVFVEVDARAHANPTRRAVIERAARDLAARLARACPACAVPGFGVAELIPGLPCSECGAPTHETRAEVMACAKCGARRTMERPPGSVADPWSCNDCNP